MDGTIGVLCNAQCTLKGIGCLPCAPDVIQDFRVFAKRLGQASIVVSEALCLSHRCCQVLFGLLPVLFLTLFAGSFYTLLPLLKHVPINLQSSIILFRESNSITFHSREGFNRRRPGGIMAV